LRGGIWPIVEKRGVYNSRGHRRPGREQLPSDPITSDGTRSDQEEGVKKKGETTFEKRSILVRSGGLKRKNLRTGVGLTEGQ